MCRDYIADTYSEGRRDAIDEVIDWFKSARERTKFRGHDMTVFHQVTRTGIHELEFDSWCIRCDKEVRVSLRPAPNETNVSGSAVAVNCYE